MVSVLIHLCSGTPRPSPTAHSHTHSRTHSRRCTQFTDIGAATKAGVVQGCAPFPEAGMLSHPMLSTNTPDVAGDRFPSDSSEHLYHLHAACHTYLRTSTSTRPVLCSDDRSPPVCLSEFFPSAPVSTFFSKGGCQLVKFPDRRAWTCSASTTKSTSPRRSATPTWRSRTAASPCSPPSASSSVRPGPAPSSCVLPRLLFSPAITITSCRRVRTGCSFSSYRTPPPPLIFSLLFRPLPLLRIRLLLLPSSPSSFPLFRRPILLRSLPCLFF